MEMARTIKSNFRRNNLSNCLTPWTAGVPFWFCLVSNKTIQYVGRREEWGPTQCYPLARVTLVRHQFLHLINTCDAVPMSSVYKV